MTEPELLEPSPHVVDFDVVIGREDRLHVLAVSSTARDELVHENVFNGEDVMTDRSSACFWYSTSATIKSM
jgi:hypothetical protein